MTRPSVSTPELKLLPQAGDRGNRLDRFLQDHLPERSRARIQALIQAGHVRIEGSTCKAGYRIKGGEDIRIRLVSPDPTRLEAEPLPLEVVYEDDDLAVVDKRAGMVVHQGAGVRTGTLVNALLHRFRTLSEAGRRRAARNRAPTRQADLGLDGHRQERPQPSPAGPAVPGPAGDQEIHRPGARRGSKGIGRDPERHRPGPGPAHPDDHPDPTGPAGPHRLSECWSGFPGSPCWN